MSSLFSVFDISGSGMSSQMVRLNTTASNLANSSNVTGSEKEAYRSRHPVFKALIDEQRAGNVSVTVEGIVESKEPVRREYSPNNPIADKDGYIYHSNVNVIEEMANMISASRSYQNNVEVMNTAKQLMIRTLQLGQ